VTASWLPDRRRPLETSNLKECTTDRQAYDPHFAGEVISVVPRQAQSASEKGSLIEDQRAESEKGRAGSEPKTAQHRAEVARQR
jgi:hypothetical protein